MSDLSKYIFLKAHDPQKSLTLRDDRENDKYTHKQIHKFEVLERPIDMVDEDNHNNNLDNDNGDYFL